MKKIIRITFVFVIVMMATLLYACSNQQPADKKINITYGVYKASDANSTITLSEDNKITFKNIDTDKFIEAFFPLFKEELATAGMDEEAFRRRFAQPYDFHSYWSEDENGEDLTLISFNFIGEGIAGLSFPYDVEEKVITFMEVPYYYTGDEKE